MLGILCGIEPEAIIARKVRNAMGACAGARPARARALARELVKHGATRLISFGIAGGLEPDLPIGSLIIGTQVFSETGKWDCDGKWISTLQQKLPEAHCGGVWGSETLIATAAEKRELYEKTRCLIVDMESQCAAEAAAEMGVPLAVLRAVCDTSAMHVPPLVMDAIAEDGSVHVIKALLSVLRQPRQIPDLLHMHQGTRKALKTLKWAVKNL